MVLMQESMKLFSTLSIGWTGIWKQLGNAWLVAVDQPFLQQPAMRMQPQVPQMLEAVLPQLQMRPQALPKANQPRKSHPVQTSGPVRMIFEEYQKDCPRREPTPALLY
jgi:hypothetical protein